MRDSWILRPKESHLWALLLQRGGVPAGHAGPAGGGLPRAAALARHQGLAQGGGPPGRRHAAHEPGHARGCACYLTSYLLCLIPARSSSRLTAACGASLGSTKLQVDTYEGAQLGNHVGLAAITMLQVASTPSLLLPCQTAMAQGFTVCPRSSWPRISIERQETYVWKLLQDCI